MPPSTRNRGRHSAASASAAAASVAASPAVACSAKKGQKRRRSASRSEVASEDDDESMGVKTHPPSASRSASGKVIAAKAARTQDVDDEEESENDQESNDDDNNIDEDEEDAEDEEEEEEEDNENEDDEGENSESENEEFSDKENDEFGNATNNHLVASLKKALYQNTPRGKFATGAQMSKQVDATFQMQVNGFGDVSLPVKPNTAKKLIALAKPSPFGKKEETIYDKKVRNSWQLDPSQVTVSPEWLRKVRAEVFDQLNVEMALQMSSANELELRLYKVLLYEKGGHFSKHRDTEKESNMFGTFIVVLPCAFGGGALLVQQGEWVKAFLDADTITRTWRSEWAAFFTDCEHELKPVTEGYRIALSFNMVRIPKKSKGGKPGAAASLHNPDQGKVDAVVKILNTWIDEGDGPLGILLKHQYSQAFLHETSCTSLKGSDAKVYAIIQAAMEQIERTRRNVNNPLAAASSSSTGSTDTFFRLVAQLGEVTVTEEGYFSDEFRERGHCKTGHTVQASKFAVGSYMHSVHANISPLEFLVLPPGTNHSDLLAEGEQSVEHTGNEGTNYERWYHQTAIILADASDAWKFIRRSENAKLLPSLFTDAVNALIAGTTTDASNLGRILGIRNGGADDSNSILVELIKIAELLCENSRFPISVLGGHLAMPYPVATFEVLPFTNHLLRLRQHCVQVTGATSSVVKRLDELLSEPVLRAKAWYPLLLAENVAAYNKDYRRKIDGPVIEFLLRLQTFNREHVSLWLIARSEEISKGMRYFAQVMKQIQAATQSQIQILTPKVPVKLQSLQREVQGAALTACIRKLLTPASATAAAQVSNAPGKCVKQPISVTAFVEQLPMVNELASLCPPETLLDCIVCIDQVAVGDCASMEPALTHLVNALLAKPLESKFLRTKLHTTLMALLTLRRPCTPIQQLCNFTMQRLEQDLKQTVFPAAADNWRYPVEEVQARSKCKCEDCLQVVGFLVDNAIAIRPVYHQIRSQHIYSTWRHSFSSTLEGNSAWQLRVEIIPGATQNSILVCKQISSVELIHERCKSDAKLLLPLQRACQPHPTNSIIQARDLNVLLPYDVANVEARIAASRKEAVKMSNDLVKLLKGSKKAKC